VGRRSHHLAGEREIHKRIKKMKNKLLNFRHGDVALIGIKELPKEPGTKSTDNVLYVGKTSAHRVAGGVFYKQSAGINVLGYLVAGDKCVLLHSDHGEGERGKKTAAIPKGVYEVRRQVENTYEGMKPVVD
jgi:hypothetical protein